MANGCADDGGRTERAIIRAVAPDRPAGEMAAGR